MKTNTLKAAAAAGLSALLMGSAAAQSVSQPVGYETITIDQQFNFMGLRLLGNPVATAAVATVDAGAGTITLENGDLTDGEFIVEVNNGDALGAVVLGDVAAGVIAVDPAVLANLAVGDSVTVRTPQTLAGIFGDPVRDLDGSAGPGAADLVLVPDGDGGFTTYFFNTGGFGGVGAGWNEVGPDGGNIPVDDPNAVNFVYTDGIVIQNRGGNTHDIVVAGAVKLTPTTLALTTQFNYIGTISPAGATLATAFDEPDNPGVLADGTISGSAGPGAADLVLIPDGSGFRTYFFNTGGFGGVGAGWNEVDGSGASAPVDSTQISLDDASSVIIQNRGSLPQNITLTTPDFYSTL